MKLYNTLTRQIDLLEPLQPGQVGVYTCGPTVYDYAHIGHWFNYIRMDILVRTLQISGLSTNWVMNITDVGHLVSDADDGQDKLEKGAQREGKTAWQVAEYYTADFLEGMKLLNVQAPNNIVKATDHIAEQIALIQTLEAKGYTYTIDDGVYFDTSKFEGYAAFAGLDLDELQAGARVSYNPEKRHVADFALWKFSPANSQRDMEWPSPFSDRPGFPGWHIECSAMSMKYLGNSFDIHTGGIDHIPVHHTNEIAQSEAATGQRFANYWLHSNHASVNGEKISKSLGNGIRLQTILEQGIPAAAVRLHALESHYRSQAKFSWDSLVAAHNRWRNWQAVAALLHQPIADSDDSATITRRIELCQQTVRRSLQQDLGTPPALSAIDELFTLLAQELLPSSATTPFKDFLDFMSASLGLNLSVKPLNDEQADIFQQRLTARSQKDWSRSDDLRAALEATGIGVRDTPSGVTIWYHL